MLSGVYRNMVLDTFLSVLGKVKTLTLTAGSINCHRLTGSHQAAPLNQATVGHYDSWSISPTFSVFAVFWSCQCCSDLRSNLCAFSRGSTWLTTYLNQSSLQEDKYRCILCARVHLVNRLFKKSDKVNVTLKTNGCT